MPPITSNDIKLIEKEQREVIKQSVRLASDGGPLVQRGKPRL